MSLSSQTIIYPNKSDATYFLVGLFQGWMLDSRLIQGNAQAGLNTFKKANTLSVKFIEVKGRRIKKKPLLCNRAGKH